jgi:hypothetical protein
VDGDGHSDVIVGAPLWDGAAGLDEGRALVYLGRGGGLASAPAWAAYSLQAGAQIGHSVATAGDVDGDGFSDVIVGAPLYTNVESDEGAAFAWYGDAAGLGSDGEPGNADWSFEADQATALFGASVATAGDVDGDGFSDVIAGATEYTNGESNEGKVYLFRGSVVGLLLSPSWSVEGNQSTALLGQSAGGAGDVNGDGYGDVVVGAHLYNNGQSDEGRAWLYYGNGGDALHLIPQQARSDDTALVGPLGKANAVTSFRLEALGRSAAGRAAVRLEWEAEPLGTPFDAANIEAGIEIDTGAPDFLDGSAVPLSQNVAGLTEGTHYHWRLRVVSDSPFFPRTPWVSPPHNGAAESDLRTAGCIDRDGDGYGAPADAGCPEALLDCDDAQPRVHPGGLEACDGLDNDCDGAADGFATTCGVGECASTGVCAAGVDSCTPGPEATEVCDGLDNDCDGTMDGFATSCGVGECASTGVCTAGLDSCTPGPEAAEVCNGLDDDCDGSVPAGEANADGDPVLLCGGDCNDADPLAWAVPVAIQDLRVEPLPAGQRLVWEDQVPRAGWSTVYDVFYGPLWGSVAPGSFSGGGCIADSQTATSFVITSVAPAPGQIVYFILRAQNTCPGGTGTYGIANRDATAATSGRPCT